MADVTKIDIIKKSKPFKIADVVVFVLVSVLIAVLMLSVYSGGNVVRVTYDGVKTDYPLAINREIVIDDKLTVVIKDGSVYVRGSSCPDKVCEHSGVIKRRNQMIICAPYGIIVTIITGDDRWV